MEDHDRIVKLEERQRAAREALLHQALEYERRLADLNHAHTIAEQKAHDYVTMAKFEDYERLAATARDVIIQRSDTRHEAFVLETHRMLDDLHRDVGKALPTPLYEEQHSMLLQRVDQVTSRLDQLEAGVAGEHAGVSQAQHALEAARRQQDRNRTLLFAVLGVILTLAVITATIFGAVHNTRTVILPAPTVTSTTIR